ncbi:macrophage erythroblast attacher [Vairimorpha ceranae]|nr:macrophage erythroblast attacher [Vairimorpha ceranae]KAF5140343.1 hypothetical protein G9O61_00g014510 [Vairimorpha ceranae]KKO75831.1 macrophage erythroblast attacher [Vairimorpha ceranae]
MDMCVILKIKKNNIIKNTRRVIDKLFLLHKQNKILDFNDKLDRLKDLVNKNINEIQNINKEISERKKYNSLIFAIVEYFNINRCYKASVMLSDFFNQKSDILFFKETDELINQYRNNKYEDLLKYLKEHKTIFKTYNIEEKVKIRHFLNMCLLKKYSECITFLKKNDIPKKYYINLLCIKDKLVDDETPLAELYEAFGVFNTRIQKRIEYGIISYKTKMCYKFINEECPACMFIGLRREVPFNRREHSVILCKGSQDLITEENRAFAYDSGHVYGENYIKEKGYLLEDNKYPRQCYFM